MTQIIVNADDYGYFPWVSAGILDAANAGTITATGVIANGVEFSTAALALAAHPDLDTGVHLNATLGRPLSDSWPAAALNPDGTLPSKGQLLRALLLRRLQPRQVAAEWRTQILRCTQAGLSPRFLNSHEHVHMYPPLGREVHALAREFSIAHVRRTTGQLNLAGGITGLLRTAALAAMAMADPQRPTDVPLLGLSVSGRLNPAALSALLDGLRPGTTYELMCHPGRAAEGVVPTALARYHDWPGELRALLDASLPSRLRQSGISLVRYRDLN